MKRKEEIDERSSNVQIMSNEEKAKDIARKWYHDNAPDTAYRAAIQMAIWKDQQMINKAREWLMELENGTTITNVDDFVEGFRKAMMEEETENAFEPRFHVHKPKWFTGDVLAYNDNGKEQTLGKIIATCEYSKYIRDYLYKISDNGRLRYLYEKPIILKNAYVKTMEE